MKFIFGILFTILFKFSFSQSNKIKCTDFIGVTNSQLKDQFGQGIVSCYDSNSAYYNGKLYTGLVKECYSNGNISQTYYRKNGISDGEMTYFYENGIISETGFIKNGNREQEWIAYYNTGRIKYKGSYLNNKSIGETFYYLDNGTLNFVLNFDNGKMISCKGNCQDVVSDYVSELENRIQKFIYLEDFEEAKANLDRILLIQPDNIKTRLSRAYVNEKLKLFDLAIIDYSRCIYLDSNNYLNYQKRGMCQVNLKQYSKAISDFKLALSFNSEIKEIYYVMAVAKILGNIETNTICSDLEMSLKLGYKEANEILQKYCN
jgi:tetratricopeptide (TPR) repeat protein